MVADKFEYALKIRIDRNRPQYRISTEVDSKTTKHALGDLGSSRSDTRQEGKTIRTTTNILGNKLSSINTSSKSCNSINRKCLNQMPL